MCLICGVIEINFVFLTNFFRKTKTLIYEYLVQLAERLS